MTLKKKMVAAATDYFKKNADLIRDRRCAAASDNATYMYGLHRDRASLRRIDRDGNAKDFYVEWKDGTRADVSCIWKAVTEGLITDEQVEQIFEGGTVETVMGVEC